MRNNDFTEQEINDLGRSPLNPDITYYSDLKTFKNGKQAHLSRFICTVGIVFDLNESDHKHRWCYSSYWEAKRALDDWDGHGSPKGAIKQKY